MRASLSPARMAPPCRNCGHSQPAPVAARSTVQERRAATDDVDDFPNYDDDVYYRPRQEYDLVPVYVLN